MQRKIPLADVPPWAKERTSHLDPDFQINSVAEVYVKYAGWKEEDARAAAKRVVGKCRRACGR